MKRMHDIVTIKHYQKIINLSFADNVKLNEGLYFLSFIQKDDMAYARQFNINLKKSFNGIQSCYIVEFTDYDNYTINFSIEYNPDVDVFRIFISASDEEGSSVEYIDTPFDLIIEKII